ncbi:hypothetical protein TRFO_08767 [Tritrichomonas foetus]|uniref:RRM domain-containing protein n=1 Tax=Tritrichomonas foetus TaxID=1144522 RepID=A0A1J4JJG7_9EUKA|nr:hypothetical protein TRFO_08767 [Tritrichomonas foetus]|eukprot:OHS98753.1 hypothetical protein TRFO_08767 [Tritrichomonas foetus]
MDGGNNEGFVLDQKGHYYIIEGLCKEKFLTTPKYNQLGTKFFDRSFKNETYEFLFLGFRNEVSIQAMTIFFQNFDPAFNESRISHVPPLEETDENADKTTLYFCNVPPEIIDYFDNLINSILPKMCVTKIPSQENPMIFKVIPRSVEVFDRVYRLITGIKFKQNKRIFATANDTELPVIYIANVGLTSVEMFKQVFSNFFTNMIDVIYQQEKDVFYALFPDNESAWDIISKFNYGRVGDKIVEITHFYDIKTMNSMKQWKIKISGIKEHLLTGHDSNNYQSFHDIYSFFKKYGPVHTIFKEFGKNQEIYSIQYVFKESALQAFEQIPDDYPLLTITQAPLAMGLYLYEISPKATIDDIFALFSDCDENIQIFQIHINASKNPIFRPYASVVFKSMDDREEALRILPDKFMDGLKIQIEPQDLDFKEINQNLKDKTKLSEEENAIIFPTIPPNLKREDIIAACAQFGTLESCRMNPINSPKTAVVSFTDESAFEEALQKGVMLKRKHIKVRKYNNNPGSSADTTGSIF